MRRKYLIAKKKILWEKYPILFEIKIFGLLQQPHINYKIINTHYKIMLGKEQS